MQACAIFLLLFLPDLDRYVQEYYIREVVQPQASEYLGKDDKNRPRWRFLFANDEQGSAARERSQRLAIVEATECIKS